ncbi:hypothetical protein D9758_000475 [Tetrapyrgos nigripes]|uniref:Uncharacterized protein n=1 Tax=Tetrapyrgos nigripes TaxID=182062 RepID=A0A8H5H1W7_9AGAR|nr:hypothetical protein D9758_000475 [Tetrapyrgos nigripes]
MTALTLEQKKQRYSRDLAEHTLRQFNSLRLDEASRSGLARERTATHSSERHLPSRNAGKHHDIDAGASDPADITPRREKQANGNRLWNTVTRAWKA